MHHLVSMGCLWSYEELYDKLKHTYNELFVADQIFNTFKIHSDHYPVTFIDEAVLEITRRENLDLPITVYYLLKFVI